MLDGPVVSALSDHALPDRHGLAKLEAQVKTPTAGPKTKRGATSVGGAAVIIAGWLIEDVAGLAVPDHVLMAGAVIVMAVLAEWSRD